MNTKKQSPKRTRLWEVVHPYYCSESNRYSNEAYARHSSWRDFMESMGNSDPDLNLLFRWDWRAPREDDDWEKPIAWQGDENYRDSILQLFWVLQRKGIFMCHEVSVCRADEPAVRAWLKGRMRHLLELWKPLVLVHGVSK